MKNQTSTLLLFLFVFGACYSQKTIYLKGIVKSFDKPIADVTIFNKTTNEGTITRINGSFEIRVRLNDTLQISSIQYEKITINITNEIFKNNYLALDLNPIVVKLKEIYLKHLTGSLLSDIANLPKDISPKHNFSLKGVDFKTKIIETEDLTKPPNSDKLTNPIQMVGAGASARIPNFAYEREKKEKALLQKKKNFSDKITQQFGLSFFTKILNISEEKIPNFLDYCENRSVFELFQKNKFFEVITILKEESVNFNAIKK